MRRLLLGRSLPSDFQYGHAWVASSLPHRTTRVILGTKVRPNCHKLKSSRFLLIFSIFVGNVYGTRFHLFHFNYQYVIRILV